MEEQVNLAAVIDQVCLEKNISKDILVETVEQAVLTAAKKVFPERDIEAEARRQVEAYDDGEEVVQETRLFDADKNQTRPMRAKEILAPLTYAQ